MSLAWVPNGLSLSRIVAGPVVIALVLTGRAPEALALFLLAAVTDGLDGWSARKLGVVSDFGAFLDPLADKALNLCALFAVASVWPTVAPDVTAGLLWIAFGLVLARDAGVTLLRVIRPKGGPKVVRLAKWKTAIEMTGLVAALCVLAAPQAAFLWPGAFALMIAGAGLSLLTGAGYFRKP